jgi:hypothetical protein
MKYTIPSVILVISMLISFVATAQKQKCATVYLLEKRIEKNSSIKQRLKQSEIKTQKNIALLRQSKKALQIINIPVVVHVLWHKPIENISTEQIMSQMDVLNEDFRLKNSDTLPQTHPFWKYMADTQINFCLANTDENGNATTGITRTYTDSISFKGQGYEKYTASGGKDNWDPTQYLNLWVCNLDSSSGNTLGYSAFPAEMAISPADDGVVIRYETFGRTGTAGSGGWTYNSLGRTATHEVGHWFNLNHIWGDDTCGDDLVIDTPPAYESNYGCNGFPYNANSACGSDLNGEMFMNYMDYSDDDCMNMFTLGQAERMQAVLNGERIGILTSKGYINIPNNVVENFIENAITVSPNPNDGVFVINYNNFNLKNTSITVVNILGETIKKIERIESNAVQINLSGYTNGVYYVQIIAEGNRVIKKIIIAK